MTASSINDTVNSALSARGLSSYASQAQPVVDALVDRETQIARSLIDYAAENTGMDRMAVRTSLSDMGMHVPALEPVAVSSGTIASAEAANAVNTEGGVEGLLARIAGQLDGLTQFARDNGYQG